MTSFILNKTLGDFAHLAFWKKYGWLRIICNTAISYCLSCMSPEDTKKFINFLIDEQSKKGGV